MLDRSIDPGIDTSRRLCDTENDEIDEMVVKYTSVPHRHASHYIPDVCKTRPRSEVVWNTTDAHSQDDISPAVKFRSPLPPTQFHLFDHIEKLPRFVIIRRDHF